MIYHVLPGDSLVEEFKKTGLDGEVIVCREALVAGPIDADTLDEFWQQRARFILTEYGDDEIEYHERVADELSQLTELPADAEVNLWFEYELFCSVNMWFCLSLLSETDASVYRVEPIGLEEPNRWDGFGQYTAEDLLAAFALRTQLSEDDRKLGAALWDAYRASNHAALRELGARGSDVFPYLGEVIAAAVEQDIQPLEILRELTSTGETDFGTIFAEFKKRGGAYGYGDLQVKSLLAQLSL
jgi:hypothetical protein